MEAQVIKDEAEQFSEKYEGRWRNEEWLNDKNERMLKIVMTFKVDK